MKYRILLAALIAGSMVLAGCEGTGAAADAMDTTAWEGEDTSSEFSTGEESKGDDADETAESILAALGSNDDTDKDSLLNEDKEGSEKIGNEDNSDIDRDAMKEAYLNAVATFNDKHILPDGTDVSDDLQPLDEDFSGNKFAVYDVDGDGVEELVISFTTTYSATMQECAYGYDDSTGELYEEYSVYPYTQYFSFGFLKEMDSHNQGVSGTFWPYTLHKYNPDEKKYEAIAYIEAWDGNSYPEDMSGNKFPSEYDKDGDGMLYYITQCSEPYDQINEEPYDYMDLSDWLGEELCDRSEGYAQAGYSIYPTWQHVSDKTISKYSKSDKYTTDCDEEFFTKFKVKDMTFWLPNDFIDKVYIDKSDDGYIFYQKKAADAGKEDDPDADYMYGFLFDITALDDEYEVDYSSSFDYYGSSPSDDGKTEYYNYVAFTPTDWPAYGNRESVDEYRDISNQWRNINEEIKDGVKFPYLPNYKQFEEEYEQEYGHSFWDDYDKSQENSSVNSKADKKTDRKKSDTEKDGDNKKTNKPGRDKSAKDSGLDAGIAAAYDEIASKKEYSYDDENGSFALHDLNADGIPELIIDPDGMFVSENLYYTYDGGKAVSIDASQMDIPVYGTFLTSSKSGTFCFYRGGPATFDEDDRDFMPRMYIEYTLTKGKVKEGDHYTGLNYDDDDSWKCSKNGKDCSYSTYNRFVKSMDGTVEFVDNTAANRRAKGLE